MIKQIGFTPEKFVEMVLKSLGKEGEDLLSKGAKLSNIWIWNRFNSGPHIPDEVRNNPVRIVLTIGADDKEED